MKETIKLKPTDSAGQARMSYAVAPPDFNLERAVQEITPWDEGVFRELTSTLLSEEQMRRVREAWQVYPRQKRVMAIHWHPEWIPMDLVDERIRATFPNSELNLIIPTQHNEILTMGDYAGVEVDCYSSGFNRKVQLLLHFKADRIKHADVLRSMLDHTFKYRSGQLFEFMDTIVNPEHEDRLLEAAAETGANDELIALVRFYTARLRRMVFDLERETPPTMIKNKLVTEFLDAQRERHPDVLINRALLLVKAVKQIVKANFSLDYFFRASEVIEEARGLGGGVVIPHPEQFWPILLADYDVDGWEVWNPQSREYTEFLIGALNHQNNLRRPNRRKLLVFMGDDTHLSVKIRDPNRLERSKLEREVGLQPAWDDIGIRKSLSLTGANRAWVIDQYMERLS
jgi:hypothetical protein